MRTRMCAIHRDVADKHPAASVLEPQAGELVRGARLAAEDGLQAEGAAREVGGGGDGDAGAQHASAGTSTTVTEALVGRVRVVRDAAVRLGAN